MNAGRPCQRGLCQLVIPAVVAFLSSHPAPLYAQTADRLDAQSDAQDARNDALLATPNLATPEPLSNLYSTAPGLEQQAPGPQWRFNVLAPFGYNSNPEDLNHGGTQTLETSPFGNLSWAAPVANLPLRVTANVNSESDRYFRASDADLDKFGVAGRVQYVDPTNDQAFSPYVAIAPRWDYLPTFSDQISARRSRRIRLAQVLINGLRAPRSSWAGASDMCASVGDTMTPSSERKPSLGAPQHRRRGRKFEWRFLSRDRRSPCPFLARFPERLPLARSDASGA